MTNRVHIDAPAGVVEIEGEKEFVEGVLEKFFPILQGSKFGSHPTASLEPDEHSGQSPNPSGEPTSEDASKSKAKRKKGSAPPKGQSCADRVLVLKGENFFKSHRSTSDIVDGLAAKGWTHNNNQVGAALTNMFNRGDIQRTKESGGPWKYYWDRD